MSQRINGALISYLSIGINIAITLAFTPFLVGSLGQDGYGLLSIILAFAAYLNVLDFGLNDSLLRFFVAYREDRGSCERFLARMTSFYLGLGVLVLVAGYSLSGLLPPLFSQSIPDSDIDLLQKMLQMMSVGAAILIGSNPASALLYSQERFVFIKGSEIFVRISTTLVLIVLLLEGYGPYSVAVVIASGQILLATLRIVYTRFGTGLHFSFGVPDRVELLRISLYAAPIFVAVVGELIFWKLDSILIGIFIGAAPVTCYAIGVLFNKYFMSFATAISRVMTPDIVRRVSAGANGTEITQLMIRISRLQAFGILLMLGGLIVFGKRFLSLWLGPEYVVSYFVMLVVLCPYALELIGNTRNIVLQVRELYWYKSAITVGIALANIPLTIWLLDIWGVIGAALSTGFGIFVAYLCVSYLMHARVGLNLSTYFREVWRGIGPIALILVSIGLWFGPYLKSDWVSFAFGSTVFAFSYAILMFFFAANNYERALFRLTLTRLRLLRRSAV